MVVLRMGLGALSVIALLQLVLVSIVHAQDEGSEVLTMCHPIQAEGMGLGTSELTEAEFQEQYGGVLPPNSWFPSEQGCFNDAASNLVIFDENGSFVGFDTMTAVCEVQPDGSYLLESWPTRSVEAGEVSFEPQAIIPAPSEGCPSSAPDASSTSVESPAAEATAAEQVVPSVVGQETAPTSDNSTSDTPNGIGNTEDGSETNSAARSVKSSNPSGSVGGSSTVTRLPSTGHGSSDFSDLSYRTIALLVASSLAYLATRMTAKTAR